MSHTDTLRRFNRTYTQRIGVLEESFLGLGMPVGEARLVYEIGAQGATVRDLRERLDLDSGYLSRLLRGLEARGLLRLVADPDDRRRRRARLTRKGRTTYQRLEDRSDQLARRLVEPLSERQRVRLSEALSTADRLVRAATVHLRSVDPRSPMAVAATRAYFSELDARFEGGFAADDAAATDAELLGGDQGVFVVATSDGEPVACGGVQQIGDGIGEVKRMWVHPDWRGAGLGSRMLRHLEALAADLDHQTVKLDTNAALLEAVAMYERAGYRRTERYNDNPYAQAWFVKEL